MPEIHVTDEKGVEHIFPDGSTPEMIAKVMNVKVASPEKPAYAGFTPGNILSNVGRGLKELGQGAVQTASDIGGAILPQAMGGDPLNNLKLVHHIVDPMQAEAAKSRAAGGASTVSGVAHAVASGVPVLGPYAANLSEQAASGDVGGALARGATQILAPKVGEVGAGLVGRAAAKLDAPAALYESALKPSTTLSHAERAKIVETGLKESIPVSKTGVEKIGDLVDDLNAQIKGTIAADPTRPISPVPALRNLQSVRNKFQTQVNPRADVQAIDAAGQEFADNLNNGGIGPNPQRNLTASEAQSMKQGTYQAIGSKAYDQRMGASVEAQKALARGLKEEIANQFPEISKLNAKESQLLDLQPVLERAVNRASNHQLFSLGTPAMAGGGALVTGSAKLGAAIGAMKMVIDNPMVKSRLAIALSKAAKIPIGKATARVNSYASTLAASAGQDYAPGDSSTNPINQ